MEEKDLQAIEALAHARDLITSLTPAEVVKGNHMALADEVPGLVSEVRRLNLQIVAWEKLVRAAADQVYALGKQLRVVDLASGQTLQVLSTEMHRECQVIKGEEPLPHAGERLREKPKCTVCNDTGVAMEGGRQVNCTPCALKRKEGS